VTGRSKLTTVATTDIGLSTTRDLTAQLQREYP